MHSSDSSQKRVSSEPGGTDQLPGRDPARPPEAASAVPVPHDIDDFLRFLEHVEAVGGRIRKPRTITVGNVFVL